MLNFRVWTRVWILEFIEMRLTVTETCHALISTTWILWFIRFWFVNCTSGKPSRPSQRKLLGSRKLVDADLVR
jgi:hypothetical protein